MFHIMLNISCVWAGGINSTVNCETGITIFLQELIHKAFLEMFQAATSKEPPAGLGDFPLSRAIYGIDLLLKWEKNEKGT